VCGECVPYYALQDLSPIRLPPGLRGGAPPMPKRSMSCVGDWQTTSTLVVKILVYVHPQTFLAPHSSSVLKGSS